MLNDPHLKILHYEPNSANIFPDTDIKGGVAVTYRDINQTHDPIEIFTAFPELNGILHKVKRHARFSSLQEIVYSRTAHRMTKKMHEDHPNAINQLSKGHPFDLSTNIFDRIPEIFYNEKPDDQFSYIQIIGRENNERTKKFVRADYINQPINLSKYKVFVPKSNGSGALGEVLSTPLVGTPLVGSTETFISVGAFDTRAEAENAFKYVKSKFARCCLGILKITQDNPPETWEYVPLQDFTANSDIDWTKTIPEIDRQLYAKYGLDENEIAFIETRVKAMED